MKISRGPKLNPGSNPGAVADKPTFIIEARRLRLLDLDALWAYRGLLYFLMWRDIKVRYKQTAIGIGWAVFQPLMSMVILTVVFSRFAGIESSEAPYPIFAFVALLPWNYFSQAVTRGAASLVGEANLISKVYFPRTIVPIASTIAPLVDLVFTLFVLFMLMLWFGIAPTVRIFTLPLFLLLAVATALGVSLWLAALNARYRDVGHVVPFLMQFWMFVSPVIYPMSSVPQKWRLLYSLNPMVGAIEGFRWAVLGNAVPQWGAIGASLIVTALLIFSGLSYFARTERVLVDVI